MVVTVWSITPTVWSTAASSIVITDSSVLIADGSLASLHPEAAMSISAQPAIVVGLGKFIQCSSFRANAEDT
jgi:hypothetical protein